MAGELYEIISFSFFLITLILIQICCRLYWADKNRIESSTIEGSDRTAVDTGLSTVVGLAVFGQYLYYADARADDGKLVGINKKGLSKGKVIQSRVTGLRDLVSVVTLDEDARCEYYNVFVFSFKVRLNNIVFTIRDLWRRL